MTAFFAASMSRVPNTPLPNSSTPGMPHGNKAKHSLRSLSFDVTDCRYGVWLMAFITTRRSSTLLNGGVRWLKRRTCRMPNGSVRCMLTSEWASSTGCRSGRTEPNQSTSPAWMAAMAVAASGMICHSIRSKCATLPPEVHCAFSARGT